VKPDGPSGNLSNLLPTPRIPYFRIYLSQCSQPSRADGRALAGYSPGRPGQGGYGRPGKASVHKDGSPMGRRPGPAVLLGTGSAGRARPSS